MFVIAIEHLGHRAPDPALLARAYRAHLTEIDSTVTAFPGIPETLDQLRQQGIRLALVTNKHEPAVSRHLGFLRLVDHFEVVVSGDQCARGKPDPEPFLLALAALGVPADAAAGVGDSTADLLSARAAGLLTAAACWGASDRAALVAARPDLMLEQPRDLLSLPGLWQDTGDGRWGNRRQD